VTKVNTCNNYSVFSPLRFVLETILLDKQHMEDCYSFATHNKQNLFTEKLEENKTDSKTLWRHLKQVGLPSKKGSLSKTNITLKINDNVCFDKKIISESLFKVIPKSNVNNSSTTLNQKQISVSEQRQNKTAK